MVKTSAFKIGDRVVVRAFNGSNEAPRGVTPSENYWQLVGCTGTVAIDRPAKGIKLDRILVTLDRDVISSGLHCHNEVQNSLWLRSVDLEPEAS